MMASSSLTGMLFFAQVIFLCIMKIITRREKRTTGDNTSCNTGFPIITKNSTALQTNVRPPAASAGRLRWTEKRLRVMGEKKGGLENGCVTLSTGAPELFGSPRENDACS